MLPRSLEGKLLVSLTLFPKQSLMRTTRCLLINIPFFNHQVLHQDRPRLIQGRKQGDNITFKLDCLKCDQSYTFEVWAVDKEDHMWEDQKVLVTEAIFSQGPDCNPEQHPVGQLWRALCRHRESWPLLIWASTIFSFSFLVFFFFCQAWSKHLHRDNTEEQRN